MTTSVRAHFESLLSSRARIGWGYPVGTPRPTPNALYEFGGGYPDPASFPYEGMVDATARMMAAEGAAAMTYGEPQGYRGLRELVCEKYATFEQMKAVPENIIVANGSGNALALAFSAFVDPGDAVIVEAPTFSGSLNTIRRHGPEIVTVPVDDDGIVTDAVRARLEALRDAGKRCKLIYTIVNFQNPAGPSLSRRRRHELVALASEFDTLVLEDDAYGELRFEGQTLPPLYALDGEGRVIRAGTLSKILGAGVRLGWLCAPREMIPAFQGFLFGGGVNPFMSRVATYYLRDHMVEHVHRLIDVYRAKRDAMLRGLDEVLAGSGAVISRPEGGFFVWMKLPPGTDQARLADLAAQARVQYTPGPAFFADGGGEGYIRLAFSYEPPEKCHEGARLIARAILEARRR
ncbi:MAG TPA: PLP-dependent aminotransferase family protein [Candidatus Tectomicrobia bacterium]|nr:PLP-dependent aminotransferase family protein [Candidatus Tectomicrobia bacterium]